MKIPEKVRLNGVDYTVQFIHDLNDGGLMLDGHMDYNHQLINLNTSSQGYQGQCLTLLHEICHGILNDYDCARLGENKRIPKDEETLVEMFARGFYQFLQDNGASLFDLKETNGNQQ